MVRRIERLSDRTVKTKKAKGFYADGDGLFLRVTETRAKGWIFRFKRDGKTHDMGLGGYPSVSLSEARQKAKDARKHRDEGNDPIKQRNAQALQIRLEEAQSVTFREAAEQLIETNEAVWKNAKHRQQWTNTLKTYAYPVLGDVPVNYVTTDLVLKVVEPLWAIKTETASRVRGRIERVLSYAKVRGWRTGENPALWRGHLAEILPQRSKIAPTEHHAALPYKDVPTFMARLRDKDSVTARALEVTVLTVLRTGEVIGAQFDEFDFAAKVWSVPPERMKGRKKGDAPFRVPLCARVIAIVREMAATKTSEFVFPGRERGEPLSNMAMLMMLRDMDLDITVHGFRSSFRHWAKEQAQTPDHDPGGTPGSVREYALSHMPKDKVKRAYLRADLLEKRRPLMEEWAKYCAVVVPITAKRRRAR
jgi:integrase